MALSWEHASRLGHVPVQLNKAAWHTTKTIAATAELSLRLKAASGEAMVERRRRKRRQMRRRACLRGRRCLPWLRCDGCLLRRCDAVGFEAGGELSRTRNDGTKYDGGGIRGRDWNWGGRGVRRREEEKVAMELRARNTRGCSWSMVVLPALCAGLAATDGCPATEGPEVGG